MFTIIGGDGKEYGPATVEQIRSWIGDGRANLDTQARRTGEDQWRRLGEFPEFNSTGELQPPTVDTAPVAPAMPRPSEAAAIDVADLIARAPKLDIFDCLKRGWDSGRAHFWPLLGVSLLVGLCVAFSGALPLIGILASLLLTGVFYGGLYFYCLKKVRGEPTEISEAFSGFSVCFVPLMLTTLVGSVLTAIGFICLILPGIYLMIAWLFSYLVVREKLLPFWDGLELSRKVVTAQWWRVFGLFLMFLLIACAFMAVPIALFIGGGLISQQGVTPIGIAMFILGGLWSAVAICVLIPFYMATWMHAYDDLFNPPPKA